MISKLLLQSSGAQPAQRRLERRPLSRPTWVWCGGLFAAIAYGSLIPFDFTTPGEIGGVPWSLLNLAGAIGPASDRLINTLLFVPVGLLFVLCVARRDTLMRGTVGAVVAAAALSLVLESAQSLLSSRISSWYDVILNVTGAAIGVWIAIALRYWGGSVVASAASRLRRRPFGAGAAALALLLLFYELFPFDFATSTEAMFSSFRAARWDPLAVRTSPIGAPPFEAFAHLIGGAVWFAVWGYLAGLANRERGRLSSISFMSAVKHGAVLVCLIEGMQLFTGSHVFDIASLVLRVVAVVFGAWSAVFVVDELTRGRWRRDPGIAVPTPLLAMAILLQWTLLLLVSLGWSDWASLNLRPQTVSWMPLRSLWQQSTATAGANVLAAFACFVPLSGTLALLFRRYGARNPWRCATAAIGVSAIFLEVLKAGTVNRTADTTDVVLAMVAILSARTAWRWLRALMDPPLAHVDRAMDR